jgi:hypothetical protein
MDIDLPYFFHIRAVIRSFLYYVSVVLIPIGFSLNILSLAVLFRKKIRNQMMGFYYIVLALLDMWSLAIYFVALYSESMGNDLRIASSGLCKAHSYLLRITTQTTSWWLVMMTLDRTLTVKYPRKFEFLRNRKLLILMLILCIITLTGINFANFLYERVETRTILNANTTNQSILLSVSCTSSRELVIIRDLLSQSFRTIIPYILMIGLNVSLIRTLINSKRKFSRNDSMRKEYEFAFGLVANNLFYFLLLGSLLVSVLVSNYLAYIAQVSPQSRANTNSSLALNITAYISFLNNSITFFTNLIFNKIFRKEFFDLLIFIRYCGLNRKISAESQETNSIKLNNSSISKF